jgi:hypothetical protein
MNRSISVFLLTIFLIASFGLAETTQAQTGWSKTIPDWEKIDFSEDPDVQILYKDEDIMITAEKIKYGVRRTVYWNKQYRPGESVVPSWMISAIEGTVQLYRKFIVEGDAVAFKAHNDSLTNRQSNEPPVAARDAPESYQTSDARKSENRAATCSGAVFTALTGAEDFELRYLPSKIDFGIFTMPDEIQSLSRKRLGDANYLRSLRTCRVVIDEHTQQTGLSQEEKLATLRDDLEDDLADLRSRIDSLGLKHRKTRSLADSALTVALAARDSAAAAKDSAEAAQKTANKALQWSKKALDWAQDNTDVFIGGGAERFANLLVPAGKLGLRVGSVELTGWYGYSSEVGTVQLPTEGEKSLNRVTSGSDLSWYVLNTSSLTNGTSRVQFEIGPSVGRVHAEDIISGREEYIRGYDAWLAGLALNLQIGPASLEAKGHYQVAREFDSSDLKFKPHGGNLRAEFGIKLYLNRLF